jgi:hypothetical protein
VTSSMTAAVVRSVCNTFVNKLALCVTDPRHVNAVSATWLSLPCLWPLQIDPQIGF